MRTPKLVTVLHRAPEGPAALAERLARIPADRRHRLVVAWPGAASATPTGALRAARDAGFARVRLAAPATEFGEAALREGAAAGLNELEIRGPGAAPWETVRSLRSAGALAFVTLARGDRELSAANPCDADELAIQAESRPSPTLAARLGDIAAAGTFRRLSVRGLPLCAVPGLAEDRVVSNALTADGDTGVLDLPSEDPERAYFAPCTRCALALACDGIPAPAFRDGGAADRLTLRAFGHAATMDVALAPPGFGARLHPAGFLSGKVHLLGVLAGARTCGRIVVGHDDLERERARLQRLGLRTAVVTTSAAPADTDPGTTSDPGTAIHLFFSRDDSADRAADLERRFSAAEAGRGGMGANVFAHDLGRLLGYPDCCIEAFAAAGKDASTADLLAAAQARSASFDWRLNCVDPRSPVTLIPHLPCRFDCAPSVALADRVLAALPALFPFLGGATRRLLSRTALLFDNDVALFDGTADADGLGISYRSVDAPLARPGVPGSSARDAWLGAAIPSFAAGSRLRLEGTAVHVSGSQGSRTLVPGRSTPRLLPFG